MPHVIFGKAKTLVKTASSVNTENALPQLFIPDS
jgi:hypothetical protein